MGTLYISSVATNTDLNTNQNSSRLHGVPLSNEVASQKHERANILPHLTPREVEAEMEEGACLAPVGSPWGADTVMATLGTEFTPRWHTAAVRSVGHAARTQCACMRPSSSPLAPAQRLLLWHCHPRAVVCEFRDRS